MPNLTTPFLNLKGEDINVDMDKVQAWSMQLIEELKYILCNLDAGNVTEANSVKAKNIDCRRARIKSCQIQSLVADKIKTGTLDISKNVTIKGEGDNAMLDISAQKIAFYEQDENDDGILRTYIGYDGTNYIFLVQNKEATQGIYMDEKGKFTITGIFATGREGEARTVIDKNGIQSYDAEGRKYGLWCNEKNSAGNQLTDLTLYNAGKLTFQIENAIDGVTMVDSTGIFLLTGHGGVTARRRWNFENGASGSFQTTDGKTVTVSGGLITDIS